MAGGDCAGVHEGGPGRGGDEPAGAAGAVPHGHALSRTLGQLLQSMRQRSVVAFVYCTMSLGLVLF